MQKFKLPRLKQCEKCPWKKSTNPLEIPDGYSIENHVNLKNTIADLKKDCLMTSHQISCGETTENLSSFIASIGNLKHVMACHHTNGDDGMYCIGWLHNQLGVGNNIGLRVKMIQCENIKHIKLDGEQHETFEQTIPLIQVDDSIYIKNLKNYIPSKVSIPSTITDTELESYKFNGKKRYVNNVKISKS